MENNALTEILKKDLGLAVSPKLSLEEVRATVTTHINHLINTDFEKLVSLLYRIDVSESKMRAVLQLKEGEDSAVYIADLIIERQLQKIESRKKFSNKKDISDEEKW
jgi:hypothetical protein